MNQNNTENLLSKNEEQNETTGNNLPIITFTSNAISQLKLIEENDFTLKGKYLRVLISGKGCDGFKYSIGFTDLHKDDINIVVENDDTIEVIVDPFTAFYLGLTQVDYKQDFISGEEGFVVTNNDQKKYYGKFWRKDETLIPTKLQQ